MKWSESDIPLVQNTMSRLYDKFKINNGFFIINNKAAFNAFDFFSSSLKLELYPSEF